MKKLTIAIDFDDTFTADLDAFAKVIAVLKDAGHQVICVTSRFKNFVSEKTLRALLSDDVPVVFANHNLKDEAARKAGYLVDIWIDNEPETIKEQR